MKDWIKKHLEGIIIVAVIVTLWLALVVIVVWPSPSHAPIFAGEPEGSGNGSAIVKVVYGLISGLEG